MGSPELTKMADFLGAGRVLEIDGAIADYGCGCDPRSGWPGLGPGLNDPALGPV